jgi:hypothetical protein
MTNVIKFPTSYSKARTARELYFALRRYTKTPERMSDLLRDLLDYKMTDTFAKDLAILMVMIHREERDKEWPPLTTR